MLAVLAASRLRLRAFRAFTLKFACHSRNLGTPGAKNCVRAALSPGGCWQDRDHLAAAPLNADGTPLP